MSGSQVWSSGLVSYNVFDSVFTKVFKGFIWNFWYLVRLLVFTKRRPWILELFINGPKSRQFCNLSVRDHGHKIELPPLRRRSAQFFLDGVIFDIVHDPGQILISNPHKGHLRSPMAGPGRERGRRLMASLRFFANSEKTSLRAAVSCIPFHTAFSHPS